MSQVRSRLPFVLLVPALIAVPVLADVVIGGFGGPLFGLSTAPNGDVLVADAGTGIIAIRRGKTDSAIPLPRVTDVSAIGRGSMWAVTGATGGPADGLADNGQALHRVSRGTSRRVVNLFAFEEAYNPEGVPNPIRSPFTRWAGTRLWSPTRLGTTCSGSIIRGTSRCSRSSLTRWSRRPISSNWPVVPVQHLSAGCPPRCRPSPCRPASPSTTAITTSAS